jgi:hypothetical protein
MRCPSCKHRLKTDVIDQRGKRFDYCVGCDAEWSTHVVSTLRRGTTESARPHPATAVQRAVLADRYEWKLGRRSFTTAYRYWFRSAADGAPLREA